MANAPNIAKALIPVLKDALFPEIKKYIDEEIAPVKFGLHELKADFSSIVDGLASRLAALESRPQVASAGGGAGFADVEALKKGMGALEARIERVDLASRATNLTLHQIREGDEGRDGIAFVRRLLPGIREGGILEARRIGAPKPGAVRPRPMLVRFADSDSKHAGYQQAKLLRGRGVFLDDDLTPTQQDARFAKQPRYHELRAQNARPFWRGARIMVHREGRVWEDGKGPAQGTASRSPPYTHRHAATGVPGPRAPPGNPPRTASTSAPSASNPPPPPTASAPPTSSA